MSKFTKLGEQIGKLVAEKQEAYGDSYGKSGKVLEVLYPDGVRTDQYPTFLAVTRVIDKLFRVATKKDAFGESPWRDIAGYALLGIAADERGQISRDGFAGDVSESIQDYCLRNGIPVEVPKADVDTMGLRIIRNNGDEEDWGVPS